MWLDLRKATFDAQLCINIQKYQFQSFEVLHLGKENRCLHAIYHGSITIHSLTMHKLLNKPAELPAILGNFYWLRQYHKHSYRGGETQSGGLILRVKWKQPNGSYFQLHITHKTATSMSNLTSQSCGNL